MSEEGPCPRCGEPPDRIEITAFGDVVPRYLYQRSCCPPPPTADQLADQAHTDWLARHHRLATE